MKNLITIAAILFALTTNAATLDLSFTDNSDNEKGFIVERSAGFAAATILSNYNATKSKYGL